MPHSRRPAREAGEGNEKQITEIAQLRLAFARIRELRDSHPSAHPAYHKHCHAHPDNVCADCAWLNQLDQILEEIDGHQGTQGQAS